MHTVDHKLAQELIPLWDSLHAETEHRFKKEQYENHDDEYYDAHIEGWEPTRLHHHNRKDIWE